MKAQTILVTGIAGGFARQVAHAVIEQGHQVVGLDYRPFLKDREPRLDIPIYRTRYSKLKVKDVFRDHNPDQVLHLGQVANLKERIEKRFDLNVNGSLNLMALCQEHAVSRLLVLSTFHIYGAFAYNQTPLYEDSPLRAGPEFPEIADAIEQDSQAVAFAYRQKEVKTAVIRPCHVIGPHIRNAISEFLRGKVLPYVLGFNPMVQFIHEYDLIQAVLLMMHSEHTGVYNVAGKSPIPLRAAYKATERRTICVPPPLAGSYFRIASLFGRTIPASFINFLKHPCVISNELIQQTLGWKPIVGELEAIRSAVFRTPATIRD